jgi:hypothetical protein
VPGFLQVLALPVIVKGANVSVEVVLGVTGSGLASRSEAAQGKGGREGREGAPATRGWASWCRGRTARAGGRDTPPSHLADTPQGQVSNQAHLHEGDESRKVPWGE